MSQSRPPQSDGDYGERPDPNLREHLEPGSSPGHGHLWVLLDGTPGHAAVGRLTRNIDGEVACHLCGRWFVHLGSHLRRHGWTAAEYRAATGLPRHVALCSDELSSDIATRQQRAWESDPEMRAHFEPGQQLARSGRLGQLAAQANRERDLTGQTPEAVTSARRLRLTQGRRTVAAQRRWHLAELVAACGAPSLHDLLRDQYDTGSSLEDLARLTGLGRARLRSELDSAGVVVRPAGANLPASRRARAAQIDAVVATRVGAADIGPWLRARRDAGTTMATLAQQCGRSVPWVRSRINHRVTTGRPEAVDERSLLSASSA